MNTIRAKCIIAAAWSHFHNNGSPVSYSRISALPVSAKRELVRDYAGVLSQLTQEQASEQRYMYCPTECRDVVLMLTRGVQ